MEEEIATAWCSGIISTGIAISKYRYVAYMIKQCTVKTITISSRHTIPRYLEEGPPGGLQMVLEWHGQQDYLYNEEHQHKYKIPGSMMIISRVEYIIHIRKRKIKYQRNKSTKITSTYLLSSRRYLVLLSLLNDFLLNRNILWPFF